MGGGAPGVGCGVAEREARVDTTDAFEAGVASLEAHSAYLAALGDAMGDAREFLDAIGRSVGTGLGTRYAAAFEVLPIRAE